MVKYINPKVNKKNKDFPSLHVNVFSGLLTLLIVAGIGIPLSLKAATTTTNLQQNASGFTGYTCQHQQGTCIPTKLSHGNCNTTQQLDCRLGTTCCDATILRAKPTLSPVKYNCSPASNGATDSCGKISHLTKTCKLVGSTYQCVLTCGGSCMNVTTCPTGSHQSGVCSASAPLYPRCCVNGNVGVNR